MSDRPDEDYTSVATEAVDWYARLRAPDVSEIEAVRFRAWLTGDPARRREFDAVDNFWEDLSAIEHSPEVRKVREAIATRGRKRDARRYGLAALAATLLVAVGATWATWHIWNADRYVTGVGEQRMVPLADGSGVMLNTSTEIKLRYSQDLREVQLLRGQAKFDVARDPSRPFVVVAGGGEVRALGTVFDVYKDSDKVTVTLIEGTVAVTLHRSVAGDSGHASRAAESAPEAAQSTAIAAATMTTSNIVLHAGEQLSFVTSDEPMKAPDVTRLKAADVPRVTAWQARKLDFGDTPLSQAIAEANRYSKEQIVLASPELGNVRISGTFEAGKSEVFVEGLQSYFKLDVEHADGHRIILTAPPEQSTHARDAD